MDTVRHPNTPAGTYDVVVIGGGPAGLGGALALARARRSVLVLDAGQPRNAPAAHAHNYLGREGVPPLELLADGREEIARYGAHVRSATVVAARATDDGFRVKRAGACWSPRGWSTSSPPTSTDSPNGGAATCSTARTATGGRCGTRCSPCSPPAPVPSSRP